MAKKPKETAWWEQMPPLTEAAAQELVQQVVIQKDQKIFIPTGQPALIAAVQAAGVDPQRCGKGTIEPLQSMESSRKSKQDGEPIRYDVILAAPPIDTDQDAQWLESMIALLAPGGYLITYAGPLYDEVDEILDLLHDGVRFKATVIKKNMDLVGNPPCYILTILKESLYQGTGKNQWQQQVIHSAEHAPVFTGTAGKIPQLIPLHDIIPDPKQPRKTFLPADLEELAGSIRKHQVLQPILLRPNPDYVAGEPGQAPFIIVFGERRWKGSHMAEMVHIPAYVEDMLEIEALELQLLENSQRKDVHPMHEGLSYKRLYDAGHSVETIAFKLNHSERYVAGRLALCDLIPELQQCYVMGLIGDQLARDACKAMADEQRAAFSAASKGRDWQNGKNLMTYSFNQIGKKNSHNLDSAPFRTEDPNLDPKMGACNACGFNTANTPQLFLDNKRECTNNVCYQGKVMASFRFALMAAHESDILMISANYKKNPAHFSSEDRARHQIACELGIVYIQEGMYEKASGEPDEDYKPDPWPEYWDNEKSDGGYDPDEHESMAAFEAYTKQEWENEMQIWQAKVDKWEKTDKKKLRKAFVVIGSGAGTTRYIKLKPGADKVMPTGTLTAGSLDVVEQIQGKEQRLARSSKLDAVKLFADVEKIMREPDEDKDDWVTAADLTPLEKSAVARALFEAIGGYLDADQLQSLAGRKEPGKKADRRGLRRNSSMDQDERGFYDSITDSEMNVLLRLLIRDQLGKIEHETNHEDSLNAALYYDVAKLYKPKEVKELELQYEGAAMKRRENANKAIEKLKQSIPEPAAPAEEPKKRPGRKPKAQ